MKTVSFELNEYDARLVEKALDRMTSDYGDETKYWPEDRKPWFSKRRDECAALSKRIGELISVFVIALAVMCSIACSPCQADDSSSAKPKRHWHPLKAIAAGAYLAGRAAQGASNGYAQSRANQPMHNYTVNGQTVNVQRNW